jgi:hypothetical protein
MIYASDLIFNLERASGPSAGINGAIYWWEHPECRDRNKMLNGPDYTGSIDAAMAFAQRILKEEFPSKSDPSASAIEICLAALKSREWHRGMLSARTVNGSGEFATVA